VGEGKGRHWLNQGGWREFRTDFGRAASNMADRDLIVSIHRKQRIVKSTIALVVLYVEEKLLDMFVEHYNCPQRKDSLASVTLPLLTCTSGEDLDHKFQFQPDQTTSRR
jgi:hypothetical protein